MATYDVKKINKMRGIKVIKSNHQKIKGDGLVVKGNYNEIIGDNNHITGNYNECIGHGNTFVGNYNESWGENITLLGNHNENKTLKKKKLAKYEKYKANVDNVVTSKPTWSVDVELDEVERKELDDFMKDFK